MSCTVHLHADLSGLPSPEVVAFLGRRARLDSADVHALLPAGLSRAAYQAMLGTADPGDDGRIQATWVGEEPVRRAIVGVLPEQCSRHNTPTRAWAVPKLLSAVPATKDSLVVVALDDAGHAPAMLLALARAFPRYNVSRGGRSARHATAHVVVLGPDGSVLDPEPLTALVEAVRHAAELVDRPPSELDVQGMVEEATALAARHPAVTMEIIAGVALRDGGFGGLWGVGKAAAVPPALVILDHAPEGATEHDAWVGKGIIYDTGGLSLKSKTGMPGMKTDMGGAAAVLAAFEAAVALGCRRRITAVLCLAENAVGPHAMRPDDILYMYAGTSVEVNNTDAEGRLVLADGVAWVARHRPLTRLIDIATLTGAQAIATGKRHAAIVSNDEDLEHLAVAVGKATGDVVFPLPYLPELLRREFQSSVADLRNSVKDRSNAQSSCAAEFIRAHLPTDGALPWLHVDMAAPSVSGGRATGYGVGLLLGLAGVV